MRRLVALGLFVAACGGKTEPSAGGATRITYDIDLARVVHDRTSELQYDLQASPGTHVTLAAAGVLVVTRDGVAAGSLRADVDANYRDIIEPRTCAPDAPPAAACFALASAYAKSLQQQAIAATVSSLRRRLDELKVSASVAEKGEQIVLDLRGTDAEMLAGARALVSRSGVLELVVVDSGHGVMKRIFDKVGSSGAEGKAIDPEALAAGISTGLDQWRANDTGEPYVDFYLRGPERADLERYFARLAASDPALAVPPNLRLGFQRMDPEQPGGRPLWRSYLLERRPALTGAEVANAEASSDANSNRAVVMLEFNRQGTRRFGDLTARITGRKLAIVIDGLIKSAPIITGPIRGGRASITMGGDDPRAQERDANELAIVLRAGAMPAPLTEATMERVSP